MNKKTIAIALFVMAIVLAGSPLRLLLPRGIRNNNPGNIRENRLVDFDWVGEAPDDFDPEFEEFLTPQAGIRAIARILINYEIRHGINTVRGIITRWAPPSENDTEAYINAVVRQTGISSNQPIAVSASLFPLVNAIIQQENGMNPYPAEKTLPSPSRPRPESYCPCTFIRSSSD